MGNGNPCKLPDDVTTDEHVTKKHLLIVIRDYSPNPFTGDASMRKLELLYTEIQKMLNHYYECTSKDLHQQRARPMVARPMVTRPMVARPPGSSTEDAEDPGNSTAPQRFQR